MNWDEDGLLQQPVHNNENSIETMKMTRAELLGESLATITLQNKLQLIFCKNLDCGALELLLVQVNKKNSIEFLFDYYTLLIHILYLLLFINFCTSLFESFPLACLC